MSIAVYPAIGATVYDDTGTQITHLGLLVTLNAYYTEMIRDGLLLLADPLGVSGATSLELDGGYLRGALVTDLTTRVGSFDGAILECSGRAAHFDGGGGTFRWVEGSATTANVGTVVGSTASGRWKRIFDGDVLDPCWFGAKGDGSTNDLTAIQLTLAALDTHDAIDFGARTYYLGTRTGASDAALQLVLSGLSDKTLISRGATFTLETTSQVSGYAPIIFKINNCQRLNFQGSWNFVDTKSWSTYASYGQTTSSMPVDWSGLSGAFALLVQEQCKDLRFGDLKFKNTRYGLSIGGIDGALPSEANRTQRVSIASLHAEDVTYPFLLTENGDDVSCPQLNTVNCLRAFDVYGCDNVKISANVRNSISGFSSIITRKKRDTSNITVDMRYYSDDGYPVQPLNLTLSPIIGYGDPYISEVDVKLTCSLVTVSAAREQQYAVGMGVYVPRTEAGAIVATDYTACTGAFRGITLDVDKGKFQQYLNMTPEIDYSTSYQKVPVKLIPRSGSGGTYDYGAGHVSDDTQYRLQRKFSFDLPSYYEFVSSDTYDAATYVFPISGWAPWKNNSVAAISASYGTQSWRWVRIGALVQYELLITLVASAATLAADHPGNWYFQLPYLPDQAGGGNPPLQEFGDVHFYDLSATDSYLGKCYFNGGSQYMQLIYRLIDNSGTPAILGSTQLHTSTLPVAATTGDTIRIKCSYMINNGY